MTLNLADFKFYCVANLIITFYHFQLAQKHIDNVLDIKDDEEEEVPGETKMVKSKTMSSIQESAKLKEEDPAWGSFNGSFFDNKPTNASPITNAPPKKCDTSSGEFELNYYH